MVNTTNTRGENKCMPSEFSPIPTGGTEKGMERQEAPKCHVCRQDHRTLACKKLQEFSKLGSSIQDRLIEDLKYVDEYPRDKEGLDTTLQDVFNALDSVGVKRLIQAIAYEYGLKDKPQQEETWDEFVKREGKTVKIKGSDRSDEIKEVKINREVIVCDTRYGERNKKWRLVIDEEHFNKEAGKPVVYNKMNSIDTFIKNIV